MTGSILFDWWPHEQASQKGAPVYRQLHRALRDAILSGSLSASTKLPSSRQLARELGVARNTVTDVYDQLAAEGCVERRHGSGTYVSDLSNDAPKPKRHLSIETSTSPSSSALSDRGQKVMETGLVATQQLGAFMPGVPDVSAFPTKIWSRLQTRAWRAMGQAELTYARGGGSMALRHALAKHLANTRAVQCTAEQIILTTGTHQSIDLTTRLLANHGDRIWLEDPCYWGLRSTLSSLGMELDHLPVDTDGIVWPNDPENTPKLALVTPSHQYPLGMVMSIARRRALLETCEARNIWLIEDDYDSEFRYGTRPLPSLQSLDRHSRVIYVGSFSKTLFPSLRLGYIVVPQHLAADFAKGSAALYREGQGWQQSVLATFIEEGHLSSHIRKMRAIYSQRRQALISAINHEFNGALPILGDDAGLHLVLGLPNDCDDLSIEAQALALGIAAPALSRYYKCSDTAQRGLLLGYASVEDRQIPIAFAQLARVIRSFIALN